MTRPLPAIACLLLLGVFHLLPHGGADAAPATALYRGEAAMASGPVRRIELQLKADGTAAWITDHRDNKAAIAEEGRWNPISTEEIEITIERRSGAPIAPWTLRLLRQGDVLRTAPGASPEFGSRGLVLKQARAAAPPAVSAPSATATALTGTWRWESLVSTGSRTGVEQPDRYTLELQAGGKALVRADCNRGSAGYRLEGRAISIRAAGMPRSSCAPGSLSTTYLKALESVVAQRVRGDQLFLDLPGEGGTMKFVRAR